MALRPNWAANAKSNRGDQVTVCFVMLAEERAAGGIITCEPIERVDHGSFLVRLDILGGPKLFTAFAGKLARYVFSTPSP